MRFKVFLLSIIIVVFFSCDNTEYETITIATPIIMSKAEFRNSVEILNPQIIDQSGKIYAYGDYIFINDMFQGVLIVDNTNPENPVNKSYIKIPGNIDIAIKDNFLYADSSIDLVVFDISDINNIHYIERLEDVFSIYDYEIPEEVQEVNWNNYNIETEVIVDWIITQEEREISDSNDDFIEIGGGDFALTTNNVGTGGSLARFQIVNNYLYTVGENEMAIFDISNLAEPFLETTQYAGWNIETMFQADGYLYLGSTNGMYIYSLSNPSNPVYISEFVHWEGCDPVVVDGDYAYLTLRGGNLCGQEESVLEVIDVSDKSNPQLVESYTLENPYGLGVKEDLLFVCDGTAGLKIFDKSDPLDLELLTQYPSIQSKDVIPLENVLLIIGEEILYQYEYTEDGISQISTFSF
ncbi:MAG: hypothetical protein HKO92_02840 [Flavobacteriaceae bacterium]|nr:hypothetical protein [Flavobacteriaceae bacterium]